MNSTRRRRRRLLLLSLLVVTLLASACGVAEPDDVEPGPTTSILTTRPTTTEAIGPTIATAPAPAETQAPVTTTSPEPVLPEDCRTTEGGRVECGELIDPLPEDAAWLGSSSAVKVSSQLRIAMLNQPTCGRPTTFVELRARVAAAAAPMEVPLLAAIDDIEAAAEHCNSAQAPWKAAMIAAIAHLDDFMDAAANLFPNQPVQQVPAPPLPPNASVVDLAAELVAVADQTRSILTLEETKPSSSELWGSMVEYGHNRNLWAHHEDGTNFHTIFTGSSLVYAGIDPALYTNLTGLSAYNMGLSAAGPEGVKAFLDDVMFEAMQPQRIILGVAPHDYWSRDDGPSCLDPLGPYLTGRRNRARAFATVDWLAARPVQTRTLGDPIVAEPNRITPMHTGYRAVYSPLGDRVFYPTLTPQQRAARPAVIAARLADFTFCQERLEAFIDLVGELAGAGYETYVVAMPLSDARVDPLPGGLHWAEQILFTTETEVLKAGAIGFIDLHDLLDEEQFYDLTHADFEASQQVTMALVDALGQ